MLIKNKKYHHVLQIITTIQSKGENSVLLLTKKLRCRVDLGKIIFGDDELFIDLNAQLEYGEDVECVEECCNDLEYVVGKLTEIKAYFSAMRCLFSMYKNFYQKKEKIVKLRSLSAYFRKHKQADLNNFSKTILKEMQMVTGVTMEEKCLEISHFVSTCVNTLSYDDEEKFLMAERTIYLMESVLGEEAAKYKTLGFCYHLRGSLQRKQCFGLGLVILHPRSLEAIRSLEVAISHYNQAKDWKNARERFEAMKMVREEINRAQETLEKRFNQR